MSFSSSSFVTPSPFDVMIRTQVDGVPVRIAEQPARVNKPTGRYMCSAMVGGDSRPGRRGRLWLAEVAHRYFSFGIPEEQLDTQPDS